MDCRVCGRQIPRSVAICPYCGSVASDYMPANNPSSVDPTVASYPPQTPNTNYGVDPYAPSLAQQLSPQFHTPPPMPPYIAPSRPKSNGTIFFIIVGTLLIALVIGGLIVLIAKKPLAEISQVQKKVMITALPTKNTAGDPYVANNGGTLILNDPMHDNSQGNKWDEATMNGKTNGDLSVCGFKNGAYHMGRTQKGGLICDPEASNLLNVGNLAYEARFTILQGTDCGVVVRFDQTKGVGYLFSISTGGTYGIDKVNFNDPGNSYTMLHSGSNKAIKTGLNQTNLVAIVANGHSLSAFVNNIFVDNVQDSTYSTGQIGVFGNGTNGVSDVIASNARAWEL